MVCPRSKSQFSSTYQRIYLAFQPPDQRLEQARKVQQVTCPIFQWPPLLTQNFQLLAALKQPTAPSAPEPVSATAPPVVGMPPNPSIQQPAANPYYPPPPSAGSYPTDPSNLYGAVPPSAAPPLNNPALAGLPPNILALLQSAQQPQTRSTTTPTQASYAIPTPPAASMASSLPAASSPQYQQLMAYLVSFECIVKKFLMFIQLHSKHKPTLESHNWPRYYAKALACSSTAIFQSSIFLRAYCYLFAII